MKHRFLISAYIRILTTSNESDKRKKKKVSTKKLTYKNPVVSHRSNGLNTETGTVEGKNETNSQFILNSFSEQNNITNLNYVLPVHYRFWGNLSSSNQSIKFKISPSI